MLHMDWNRHRFIRAERIGPEHVAGVSIGLGHPQTLFNLGWVRWQGKADPKGAIEAWQSLLKSNPDYPQKQQVEQIHREGQGTRRSRITLSAHYQAVR
jgi:hypothetical protein